MSYFNFIKIFFEYSYKIILRILYKSLNKYKLLNKKVSSAQINSQSSNKRHFSFFQRKKSALLYKRNSLASKKLLELEKFNLNFRQLSECNFQEIKEKNTKRSYLKFLAYRSPFSEHKTINTIKNIFESKKTTLRKKFENSNLTIITTNISSSFSLTGCHSLKKSIKNSFTDISIPYLFFNSENIKAGETKFKAEPPIRDESNRKLLINAISLGLIDSVSSNQFTIPPIYKCIENEDFSKALNGNCSIGVNLLALWTVLAPKKMDYEKFNKTKRNETFRNIAKVLSTTPAKSVGIFNKKGSISIGKHADFVIWDPFKKSKLKFPNNSVYGQLHLFHLMKLRGKIYNTYLRGKLIYDRQNPSVLKNKSLGKILK